MSETARRSASRPSLLTPTTAPRSAKARIPYSEEIALKICDHIGGGKSLRAFCELPGTPTRVNVYFWLNDVAGFREMYNIARQDGADSLADEIVYIADTEEDPKKARVMIDARKWVASKLKPNLYGDRVQIAGDKDSPLHVTGSLAEMSDDELHAIAVTGAQLARGELNG